MSASASDYFKKVASPGGSTSLAAPGHTIGGTSFTVDSTALWPTDTGVTFAIDTVTISGGGTEVRDTGSYTVWDGVVASATTITGCVLRYGTDQNYPAGSTTRVYILPTSTRENKIVDGLLVAHNQDGTIKNNAVSSAAMITDGILGDAEMATAVKPVTLFNENTFDHVVSGCVITADNAGTNKNYSVSSGVVMIAGKRLTVGAVSAVTVTASKDRYVDATDNGDGTAVLSTTAGEVNNNAASPALAASSIRIGIVVAGATTIATAASINQGQEDRVLPIASSIPYAVTDSLGNLICPRDPSRKILGYRQSVASQTGITANVALTALSVPVIVPTGRKIKVTGYCGLMQIDTANTEVRITIYDGTTTGGTQLGAIVQGVPGINHATGCTPVAITTPSTASKNYILSASTNGGSGTALTNGSATTPNYIMVELV